MSFLVFFLYIKIHFFKQQLIRIIKANCKRKDYKNNTPITHCCREFYGIFLFNYKIIKIDMNMKVYE